MSDGSLLQDYTEKLGHLRSLLREKKAFGILITTVVNFSWLTNGRSFVNLADESSSGKLLVTEDKVHLIAPKNEVPRLLDEELAGFDIVVEDYPWYRGYDEHLVEALTKSRPYIVDRDVEPELSQLRMHLSPRERSLLKGLGRSAADILEDCCQTVERGEKECEIAGRISRAAWSAGMEPLVVNIAADGRSFKYRHPIPTENRLDKYVVMSVCLRKWGLHVTLTRALHFGSVPAELRARHHAAAHIEAFAISRTRANVAPRDIVRGMIERYRAEGFADEWRIHPIGGAIGYKPREYDATDTMEANLEQGQAFCWNPTISGTKSEDSLLVLEDRCEIVTASSRFPMIDIDEGGSTVSRPDILER
jgi:Xaa-Pro aminopeptidase